MASAIFCDRPRAAALPPESLRPDPAEAARYLGAKNGASDPVAIDLLQSVLPAVTAAARPRMAWASMTVSDLTALGLLQGEDVKQHLSGCDRAVLLAVTLGPQTDTVVRRAGVGNVAKLAAADAAASALTEAAANAAEAVLRAEFSSRGLFLTGRYAPGYGDWPLSLQPRFCALLDTARLLGLSAGADDLLLPRKSTTALLGVSAQPVSGHRAGCEHCALREHCNFRKGGTTCADP